MECTDQVLVPEIQFFTGLFIPGQFIANLLSLTISGKQHADQFTAMNDRFNTSHVG